MDLVQLAAFIIVMALAFYAVERLPMPGNLPWAKKALEIFLALICIVFLLDHVFGVHLLARGA